MSQKEHYYNYYDDYALEGFQIFRNDYNASSALRSPYGSVLYVKNDLDCVYNYNGVEITVCIHNKPVNHLHVVGIYRSKKLARSVKLPS